MGAQSRSIPQICRVPVCVATAVSYASRSDRSDQYCAEPAKLVWRVGHHQSHRGVYGPHEPRADTPTDPFQDLRGWIDDGNRWHETCAKEYLLWAVNPFGRVLSVSMNNWRI